MKVNRARMWQVTAIALVLSLTATVRAADARAEALARKGVAADKIRSALSRIVGAAPALAELLAKLNTLDPAREANSEALQKVHGEIEETAPGFWYLALAASLQAKNGKFESDPVKVARGLQVAYEKVVAELDSACFAKDGTYDGSARCKALLASQCSSYSSSVDGVTLSAIKDDLSIEEIPVASVDDVQRVRAEYAGKTTPEGRWEDLPAAYAEHEFEYCMAASLSGEIFEAQNTDMWPSLPPATKYPLLYSEETIRAECFAVDVFGARRNLATLQSRFPRLAPLKRWAAMVSQRAKGCEAEVKRSCVHTYPLKDEVVLAYLTEGCEVREVIAQDVDEDVQRFADAGLTRAQRLKHTQLKDTIAFCKDALASGYLWLFREPSKASCTKPTRPKKKSKG